MSFVPIRFLFRAGFACLALALAATACTETRSLGSEPEGRNINPAVGRNVVLFEPAKRTRPLFSGETLDGKTLSQADFAGSVTVVNFWASWCGPCYEEEPILVRAWNKYRDRGVLFVGVNVRDTVVNARAFAEDFEVTYPSIFDEDQRIAHAFRVLAPPSTFVLDRSGRIAARVTGAITEAGELDVVVDEVLAE